MRGEEVAVNFGNMGFWEILIIMVLVLLLFGAKRLPEMGASIGKGIRSFKKGLTEVEREVTQVEREPAKSERLAPGEADVTPAARAEDEKAREPKRLLS
jgi:sec-independent protein translocase protein TatA